MFKKKDKKKGVNSSTVHVRILRLMSDRTPVEILEFNAIQERDINFNIQIVNEDVNFKEELAVQEHKIIEYLKYRLNLTKLTRKEKIKIINDKVTELEDKVKECEKDKDHTDEDNDMNIRDYEAELMHYKVLRYSVQNGKEGSYERINIHGQREIQFLYQDGVLVPYFMLSSKDDEETLTMYPDVASKRKFYRETDNRILEEFMASQTNFFTGFKGMVVTIAIVALVIGLVIGNLRVIQRSSEIEDVIRLKVEEYSTIANGVGLNCAFYYSSLMKTEALNNSILLPAIDDEKDKGKTASLVDMTKALTDS